MYVLVCSNQKNQYDSFFFIRNCMCTVRVRSEGGSHVVSPQFSGPEINFKRFKLLDQYHSFCNRDRQVKAALMQGINLHSKESKYPTKAGEASDLTCQNKSVLSFERL